jgi:hypothetical protein
VIAFVSCLAFAATSSTAESADPCKRTEFKTQLVKDACAKGGQAEAKDQMKAFMKSAKIKSCNQCHAKLAPNYELKADGVKQFTAAGGKLADDKAAPAPTK